MSSKLEKGSVADFLRAIRSGDPAAESELWALAYDELRAIARRILTGEHSGLRFQTTALVHEAYVRLADKDAIKASDRPHFFAIVARMMRRVLVDKARERHALKRGGGEVPESLSTLGEVAAMSDQQLVALDIALGDLARLNERQATIVELNFFGGYPFSEIAQLIGCSERTVERQWRTARLWLFSEMTEDLSNVQPR